MLDNVLHFNGDRNTRDLMSDAKFFEGYSRWDETKNRYETWSEAVNRVMNMHRKFYADVMTDELSGLIDEAEELYRQKYFLGAQRALQFGGDQLIKHQMRLYNCTSSYADRAEFFGEFFYILLCGAGAGVSVQKHHIAKLPKIQARTKQAKIFTPNDSIEGWADCADILLSSYFTEGGKHSDYEGRRVYFDLSKIRERGSMISGGFKAPGPEPLRRALDKIEHLLQGLVLKGITELSPIHVYDICMHLADAVLAGGVRRSATIFLFSPDDDEMMKAKTGNWFVDNPQRGRSNNSAVIVRETADREQFAKLMESVREFGEPGFVFVESTEHTYNPCLSGDTMVKVKDHDVISNGEVIANGIEYEIPMEELKKMYSDFKECGGSLEQYMPLALSYNTNTGEKEYKQILWADKTRENAEMVKIILDDGKTVRCTPDHKIYTTNRGYVEAKDLTENDDLVIA